MPRIIIISNRLPVTAEKGKREADLPSQCRRAGNWYVPFTKEYECLWVGWPGIAREQLNAKEKESLVKELKRLVIIHSYLKPISKDITTAFAIRLSGLYSIVLPNFLFMKTSYGKPINKSTRFFAKLYLI